MPTRCQQQCRESCEIGGSVQALTTLARERPLCPWDDQPDVDGWAYERGWSFARLYPTARLMEDGHLSRNAVRMFRDAFARRDIL
jgi:hypothetical protein